MPINIPDGLPAQAVLESENIFVINEHRATHQDIRPLRIVILNLMPKKIETETQLLRLLSNSPIQVDIELLLTASHVSKNTPSEHLLKFYKTFDDIKDERFHGMIITGAPVEQMDFEEVDYWPELCQIMAWSKTNVYSTFHICWGAQAGLYYHYGIPKHPLPHKMFGIFPHTTLVPDHPLLRGFDERFMAPHSDVYKRQLLHLWIQCRIPGHDSGWIAPFGHPRINVCLRLPVAYRSLLRPSSAPSAKAFALRPF